MREPSVKTNADGVIFPDFTSEREEAEWWDKNSDFFMERLRTHGKAVYPGIEKAKKIVSKRELG